MNQSTMRRVSRMLRSCADRTNLDLAFAGVRVELRRRNSQYVSHRRITFSPAGYESRAVWIVAGPAGNTGAVTGLAIYVDGVAPSDDEISGWIGSYEDVLAAEQVVLPASMLAGFLDGLHQETGEFIPKLLATPDRHAHLLIPCVIVSRRLVGWREETRRRGTGRRRFLGRTGVSSRFCRRRAGKNDRTVS